MSAPGSCLLVAGSPRARGSTSRSLGSSLLERLGRRGRSTKEVTVYGRNGSGSMAGLMEDMAAADLVVLAFPLYIDSPPSQVMRLLEVVYEEGDRVRFKGKGLAAIVNSGFPDAGQMSTAIGICRIFARDMGMDWKGALAMPAGPVLGGSPPEGAGGRARHQLAGLDSAAEALSAGSPIPEAASQEFSRLGVPRWLCMLIANRSWARTDLRRAPYR